MDQSEFEFLRDLPGKTILGDIVLQRSKEAGPLLCATVSIRNSAGIEARLRIEWNEQTDAKTLNVFVPGTGPICRLEVDGRSHKPHGRSHKHALKASDCPHPSVNLSRDIIDRPDLSGKGIKEVFADFCHGACINHEGRFSVGE